MRSAQYLAVVSSTIVGVVVGPTDSRADWNAHAKTFVGASAWSTTNCIPAGGVAVCQDPQWGAGSAVSACTSVFPAPPIPITCWAWARSAASTPWSVSGGGNSGGGGDWVRAMAGDPYPAQVEMTGERMSATTFRVHGISTDLPSDFREIAVFRYAGDHQVLSTLTQGKFISDLVSEGIISASDVLFHQTNDDIPATFDYSNIDVTNIPDDELLVWAAGHGTSELNTGVGGNGPVSFALLPNVPNPFNAMTTIRFVAPGDGSHVSLAVYDVQGRLVRALWDGSAPLGPSAVQWDGRDIAGQAAAAGVYFCKLVAPGVIETRKLVLMR